ncbi:MAG TPA: hypothetical protein VI454_14710 [Verrucomicrobiae bacterium]|jgi:hypothetical protein
MNDSSKPKNLTPASPGPGETSDSPAQPPSAATSNTPPGRPTPRRRTRLRRNAQRPVSTELPQATRRSWEKVKRHVEAALRKLDRPALKEALVAGGIALAAALAIIALCKFVPVVVALLVVLGLGLLLRFWQELCRLLGLN